MSDKVLKFIDILISLGKEIKGVKLDYSRYIIILNGDKNLNINNYIQEFKDFLPDIVFLKGNEIHIKI